MFNPMEHMMQLKGKDYLQVQWRLVWFREDHPDWVINTDCVTCDAEHAIFKATISDENGIQKSAGHGSESKKDFADFLEKAETKAVGRALAMLGYGTQFAADELDEGERIVDSPVSRKPEQPTEHESLATLFDSAKLAYGIDQAGEKMKMFLDRTGYTKAQLNPPQDEKAQAAFMQIKEWIINDIKQKGAA